MRAGRAVVFLAHSDKFKEQLALQVRAGLAAHGVDGIILSEEPLPPNANWDVDTKVEKLLDQSDAFAALATPDDQLADGTVQTRQNIIEELTRARHRPGLRDKTMVFKARLVRLPSNMSPTYFPLDPVHPEEVVRQMIEQLEAWNVLARTSKKRRA